VFKVVVCVLAFFGLVDNFIFENDIKSFFISFYTVPLIALPVVRSLAIMYIKSFNLEICLVGDEASFIATVARSQWYLLTVPWDRKRTNKVSVLRRPFNGIWKAFVVEKYLEKWQVCLLKGNLDPCVSSAVKVINDFGKASDSYHAGVTAPLVRDISLTIYFCCSVLQIESVRS